MESVRETCFNLTKDTKRLVSNRVSKNPVAKTSKELVCFFCRSARFAVLQVLFSGSAEVAAGLSNENQESKKKIDEEYKSKYR